MKINIYMTIPIFALITTIVQSHHFSFSFFLILLVSPTTKYPYEINNDYGKVIELFRS